MDISSLALSSAAVTPLFAMIALWSIVWKGFGLWKAAKNGNLFWFIVILVINSAGILEIIYLFVVNKEKLDINGLYIDFKKHLNSVMSKGTKTTVQSLKKKSKNS